MSVKVELKGIKGEPNAHLLFHPRGVEVVVKEGSFWARNPARKYSRLFKKSRNWGNNDVAFQMVDNVVKVVVFIPHHLITLRKAEFVIPSNELKRKLKRSKRQRRRFATSL